MDTKLKGSLYLVVILSLMLLTACGGRYECVPEADQQSMITFGVVTGNADEFDGYAITADGKIYKENWEDNTPVVYTEWQLDEEDYCIFRDRLLDLFQETQATNQTAEITHYMEYAVPGRKLKLRARWNPAFDNAGNEKWKKLWNDLENMIREEAETEFTISNGAK